MGRQVGNTEGEWGLRLEGTSRHKPCNAAGPWMQHQPPQLPGCG
jgi:hypothetical protein